MQKSQATEAMKYFSTLAETNYKFPSIKQLSNFLSLQNIVGIVEVEIVTVCQKGWNS